MDSPDLRKNKLRQIGLRVPLMLEFNTNRAKLPSNAGELEGQPDWSFSKEEQLPLRRRRGGQLVLRHHVQAEVQRGWHNVKQRSKDDYNLLPYRLAARAQIGINGAEPLRRICAHSHVRGGHRAGH
jgi:hypothetical protein